MKLYTEELDWDFAMLWEAKANEKKEIHNEPKWKWHSENYSWFTNEIAYWMPIPEIV